MRRWQRNLQKPSRRPPTERNTSCDVPLRNRHSSKALVSSKVTKPFKSGSCVWRGCELVRLRRPNRTAHSISCRALRHFDRNDSRLRSPRISETEIPASQWVRTPQTTERFAVVPIFPFCPLQFTLSLWRGRCLQHRWSNARQTNDCTRSTK